MDVTSFELSDALRHLVAARASLSAIARSPTSCEVLLLDCGGLATDIDLALQAYEHLWGSQGTAMHQHQPPR